MILEGLQGDINYKTSPHFDETIKLIKVIEKVLPLFQAINGAAYSI
jgi:hypothetical protein